MNREQSLVEQLRLVGFSNVFLGFSIVLLEAGFILAFRAGWNIGYAALVSNTIAALVLVPISIYYFHGTLTGRALTGIVVVAVGLGMILI